MAFRILRSLQSLTQYCRYLLWNKNMLGLLVITAIPTTVGVTQALRFKDKQAAAANDADPVRFTVVALCEENAELNKKQIVLHDKKVCQSHHYPCCEPLKSNDPVKLIRHNCLKKNSSMSKPLQHQAIMPSQGTFYLIPRQTKQGSSPQSAMTHPC